MLFYQDWLQAPPSAWQFISEYKVLEDFIRNVTVTNYIAERVSVEMFTRKYDVILTVTCSGLSPDD